MDFNEQQRAQVERYLADVFGTQDEHLAGLMDRATDAGLPDIAVSPEVGRMLMMLAQLVGARTIVELGTLAGYSGIWLARGLAPGGRLITAETEPEHAEFAKREFERAGVADRVEIRLAPGLMVLEQLTEDLGLDSVDLVFLDAIKSEYPLYFERAHPLIRPGGLLVADNVVSSSFVVTDPPGSSANRDGVDAFNRAVAAHPDYEAVVVPLRQGVLVARKRS